MRQGRDFMFLSKFAVSFCFLRLELVKLLVQYLSVFNPHCLKLFHFKNKMIAWIYILASGFFQILLQEEVFQIKDLLGWGDKIILILLHLFSIFRSLGPKTFDKLSVNRVRFVHFFLDGFVHQSCILSIPLIFFQKLPVVIVELDMSSEHPGWFLGDQKPILDDNQLQAFICLFNFRSLHILNQFNKSKNIQSTHSTFLFFANEVGLRFLCAFKSLNVIQELGKVQQVITGEIGEEFPQQLPFPLYLSVFGVRVDSIETSVGEENLIGSIHFLANL